MFTEIPNGYVRCNVCKRTIAAHSKDAHSKGASHKAAVASRFGEAIFSAVGSGNIRCNVCDRTIAAHSKDGHANGAAHVAAVAARARAPLLNKGSAECFTKLPNGKVHCNVCDRTMEAHSKDGHANGAAHVAAVAARARAPLLNKGSAECFTKLPNGKVHCNVCDRTMEAHSKDGHAKGACHMLNKCIAMARVVSSAVRTPNTNSGNHITDEQSKARRKAYRNRKYRGAGSRPDYAASAEFLLQTVRKLPFVLLTDAFVSLFATEFPLKGELHAARRALESTARDELSKVAEGYVPLPPIAGAAPQCPFTLGSVSDTRQVLTLCTMLEETAVAIELTAYNKEGVPISLDNADQATRTFHRITMPGVSENRPSVLRGDKIIVYERSKVSADTDDKYASFVHFINDDETVLSLPPEFAAANTRASGRVVDIVFKINRGQELKMYRAIKDLPEDAVLTAANARRQLSIHAATAPLTACAPHLVSLNAEQLGFVAAVRGPTLLSALWGPPGTGKTTTMVAAIADTLLEQQHSRLLVCAPSNEAADLLAERLVALSSLRHISTTQGFLMRLPGMMRPAKALPAALIPYCPPVYHDTFTFPARDAIDSCRVVVTTLMTADRLYAVGAKPFSHVFVDEAGHASEQLLMVGLNAAGNANAKVVLAGDPKQLGPRTNLPLLREAALHRSPLERICSDAALWPVVGSQLHNCYRCHPDIVGLVNVCYDGALIAARAAEAKNNAFAPLWCTPLLRGWWDEHCHRRGVAPPPPAPTSPRAVLALDHTYPEAREKDSPSWKNEFEVRTVVQLCEALLTTGLVADASDIAVITPYRKQRTVIENRLFSTLKKSEELSRHMITIDPATGAALRRPRVPIRVATVDAFQGREAKVVIVSCVRSNMRAGTDSRFGLGFVGQPERANVALSRAKDLLIVVGNSRVLCTDPTWAAYYAHMRGMGEAVVMDLGGPEMAAVDNAEEEGPDALGDMAADERAIARDHE